MLIDDNKIYVVLANTHDQPIKTRTDFLLARLLGGLAFDIRRGGAVFPITAHIDAELPTEKSYAVLSPGELTGQTFDLPLIARFYMLQKGCYTISVIYHDGDAKEFGGFGGEVKSKPMALCVG